MVGSPYLTALEGIKVTTTAFPSTRLGWPGVWLVLVTVETECHPEINSSNKNVDGYR